MSNDDLYGLQDNEFRVKTLPTILAEKLNLIRSLMGGRVSLQEGDPLYQFILIDSMREERLWRLAHTLFQLMSISGASGTALDRHGEDLALKRGGATNATVNLLITGTPGNSIPIGSKFETYEGVQFETTEEAELPSIITMTRSTSGNRDSIPSPYSGLVVVDWVSDSQSGEGAYSANLDYIADYDNDVIDWSPTGLQPEAGATYYVKVSSSISVTVAAQSVEKGSSQNVPANTITSVVSSLSGISSVTNPLSTGTTGQDAESDTDYRLRLLRAGRRNWTVSRIRAKIEEIDDVISTKIFIGDAVDQYNIEETDTVDTLGDQVLGQLFKPADRIGSMSAVEFKVKVAGTPGDLMVELYRCQYNDSGILNYDATINSTRLAYARISPSDIDPFHKADQFFEYKTELKYNHLDNTKRYLLLVYSMSNNATNYYEFMYGTSGSYGYGGLYRNGILHTDQNLWFKTWFPTASFTSVIAPRIELSEELKTEIEDVVTNTGRAVSIQHVVEEATVVRVQVTGRLKLASDEYTLSEVSNGIETRLYNYLAELDIGEDVIWDEVLWCIMEEPGVVKTDDVRIKYKYPDDATFSELAVGEDLPIGNREIAKQATVGVQFEQFWTSG